MAKEYTYPQEEQTQMASEPAASFVQQASALDSLRHHGVETFMKIDDPTAIRIIVTRIDSIYNQRCVSISNENRLRLTKTLDTIASYTDNWDDEGAPAILPEVIEATRQLLDTSNDILLSSWALYPCANGTLKLETHQAHVNAGINIGSKEFTYYIHHDGEEQYGRSSLTLSNLRDVLSSVYYGRQTD